MSEEQPRPGQDGARDNARESRLAYGHGRTHPWWPELNPWNGSLPMVRSARAYASVFGWHVIPVFGIRADGRCECGNPDPEHKAGKHPRIPDWPHKATTDLSTITLWWQKWPRANIGLATGRASGVVALDVDIIYGGAETLDVLESAHGALPDTVQSLTGSGGFHFLFAAPYHAVSNSTGTLGPGLDVRGDGGQIVVPPSIHASGRRYLWEASLHPMEMPLAPWPVWLDALLNVAQAPGGMPSAPTVDKPWLRRVLAGTVPEGVRHDTATALMGYLLRRHVDPELAVALLDCWNAHHVTPPLTEDELSRIANDIAGRERQRRKGRPHG